MFHSVTGGRVEKRERRRGNVGLFARHICVTCHRLMKGTSATSNGNKGCQARAVPGERLPVISELEMHLQQARSLFLHLHVAAAPAFDLHAGQMTADVSAAETCRGIIVPSLPERVIKEVLHLA